MSNDVSDELTQRARDLVTECFKECIGAPSAAHFERFFEHLEAKIAAAFAKDSERVSRVEAELKDYKSRCQAWADSDAARTKYITGVEQEQLRLRSALVELRDDIIENAKDTLWAGDCETACERITSILGDDWGKDGKCESSRQADNEKESGT